MIPQFQANSRHPGKSLGQRIKRATGADGTLDHRIPSELDTTAKGRLFEMVSCELGLGSKV
jgi:hypothetical protein